MDRKTCIEYIEWIDHHSVDEWTDIDHLDLTMSPMHAAGLVVKEDNFALAICPGFDPEELRSCCTLIIYKPCIIRREVLHVYEDEKET